MNGPAFLVWAHVLLVWSIAAYVIRDPLDDEDSRANRRWIGSVIVRAVAAAIAAVILSGSTVLATLLLVAIVILATTRSRLQGRYGAELEIGMNALVATASLVLITRHSLQLEGFVLRLPASNDRIAAACLVVALLLFTVHGGTYVVRGLLKKSGAVPMTASVEGARTIDVKEFNRGRLIGTLERVLLFAVVIAGSYEALGFIVAAKGLIRSREFETSRDMTEYVLIGSLASVLVALTTGSIARHLLATYR